MFEGRVESVKRVKLVYDDVERQYHVNTSLIGAMAKKHVCKACKICRSEVTHVCVQKCSDCATSPPCSFGGTRIPCEEGNRHFRSRSCFDNHKRRNTAKKSSVCERKRLCGTCGVLVTRENHECNKRYCENCRQIREAAGHLCYMRLLKDALPSDGDRELYVFYDFEIRGTPTRLQYTYLIWPACNSFVRSAKGWKIAVIVCDAVNGSTRCATIRLGFSYYTYGCHAPGPISSS